jgi:integrase
MTAMMRKQSATGFIKYIDPEEVRHLDEWFAAKGDNYTIVYYLMKYCGLRVSDAVRAQVSWISNNNLCFVMHKTKKAHIAYMPRKLREYLYEVFLPRHELRLHEGYLAYNNAAFSSNASAQGHLQESTIRLEFCRFRKFYGMQGYYEGVDHRTYYRVTPHAVRHLFAETAYMVSAHDAKLVQDLLGHAKTETTFRYYLRGVKGDADREKVGELIAGEL